MIKVSNLNKYYNKKKNNEIHVINNVNLTLPDTGLITFLGKSGSGKTTLLNVIGGLDKASGSIEYDDVLIKRYSMTKVDKLRREKISYIFQNYNLLLNKTVYENLSLALYAINITDKDEVLKRSDYALKAVGMYKYRKKLAGALSGGQMQRVAIARCLIKESSVIIADEPTGNLDSNNSLEIMNILKKISKKSLVLLVTHDKALAEYFSDSIIEVKDGEITGERETNKDSSAIGANGNNIYLKDLNKKELCASNTKITYYLETDEDKELELELVEHNKCLYLKSNVKIKLLEDTNFKLVDASASDEVKVIKDDLEFDSATFSSNLRNSSFRLFLKQVKDSFFSFFVRRKRTKFFHVAMILIGMIVAAINISYATYNVIDKDNIAYDNDVYRLYSVNDNDVTNVLRTAKVNGYIKEFYTNNDTELSIVYYDNSYSSKRASANACIFDVSLINGYNIIKGKNAEFANELVLSKKIADALCSQIDKNATYDTILGLRVSKRYGNGNYTIVGICDKDAYAGYSIVDTSSDDIFYLSSFTTNDYARLKQYLENNNCKVDTLYKATYNDMKTEHTRDKMVLVPVIIILVSITLVYIYFAMRSKMISDIYSIGVYRSIAYSRTKIVLKYVVDIFFITLFTTLLGYILVSFIYSVIVSKINALAVGLIKQTVIANQGSTYIIGAGIFLVSIIIGILPILGLLRKTPSQILAKYDI